MGKALHRAIEVLGSQAALARALGVSEQAVSRWRKNGKVPMARAIEVERACQAQVTRYELRPDLYPR